jgi:hypothetical protein
MAVFSLLLTGVNPFRDFIRPALKPNGIKPHKDFEPRLPGKSLAAHSKSVGPMKPLQGSTPVRKPLEQISERSFS